jgi:methyl-accepting chemotaxis protein
MGVQRKLYLLLGVSILGFVCLFVADRIGKQYADKYRTLESLAAHAYLELLQARGEEKNFLMRLDPACVALVLRHADAVQNNVEQVIRLDDAQNGEARQALVKLAAYRKGFEELAEIARVKGLNEHEGLMRDFVYAARELDEKFHAVGDRDLEILLLTIRRHEKNWQLRDEADYVEKVGEAVKRLAGMVAENSDLTSDRKKGLTAVIDNYRRSFTAYVQASAKAKLVATDMVRNGRDMMPLFEKIETQYAARRAEVQSVVEWMFLGVQAALGLVVLLTILWITRGITGSLAALAGYSRQVAAGDLQARPTGRFEAEFAALRDDITTMVDNLKEKMRLVAEQQAEAARQARTAEEAMRETMRKEEELTRTLGRMQEVAEQAADISRRLSDAAQDLSAQTAQATAGVELQQRRVTETATAMEQMNATVMEIASNAGQAAGIAGNTRENAVTGAAIVHRAGESIARVNDIAVVLKNDMAGLGREAESIGQVVGVINDIADQTNLLALNAAIEAARAGEAGRGFAVVADEVRKLAEKTMVATQEVESRIRAIQEAAGRNIRNMDQAVAAVGDANALAGQSGEAIQAIVGHADTANAQIQSIATAAEEQSAASEQISRALGEINRVAEDNVAGVEASSRAAQSLTEMAGELQALIVRLRGEETGPMALAA